MSDRPPYAVQTITRATTMSPLDITVGLFLLFLLAVVLLGVL